jgi:hypothetical protein
MTLHVLFTKDGIPGWIGSEPRDGSEPIDGLTVEFLAGHRRNAKGKWVERGPVVAVQPPEEEVAAQRAAEYQAVLAARDEAIRLALATEADPQFFRWQRGEVAKEDWLAAVAEVKARFPKPEPV